MSNPPTGINADSNLYEPSLRRRSNRLLKMISGYDRAHHIIGYPWLDVGAGESYMRNLLEQAYENKIDVTDCDLDVDPFPYPDGHFKLITSFEVLEHLYNPLYHLMELRRVLADDGNMIIVTPNDYSLIYKAEHLLSRKYRPHFHQFCERDLYDLVKRAELSIVEISKFFKSPSGTLARISRNGFWMHLRKHGS